LRQRCRLSRAARNSSACVKIIIRAFYDFTFNGFHFVYVIHLARLEFA